MPITEGHPLQGQSPYSASKIGTDQLAQSFYQSFSLPVAIIRPFNTYGARQSARAVIRTTLTQIASGITAVKLSAMTPTRDFSFAQVTVRRLVAVAESENAIGRIINGGSNYEVSISDTANLIAELMGRKVEFVGVEERWRPAGSEVERLRADNTLAMRLLYWRPLYGG